LAGPFGAEIVGKQKCTRKELFFLPGLPWLKQGRRMEEGRGFRGEWKFAESGVDGDCALFSVNIFDYA
jgi:hypothetical protein